jgi:Zn-dependent metalloprotease
MKILITCAAVALLACGCGGGGSIDTASTVKEMPSLPSAKTGLDHPSDFVNYSDLRKNPITGAVSLIRGSNLSEEIETHTEYQESILHEKFGESALYFLSQYCGPLNISCGTDQFIVKEVATDKLGFHQVRLRQEIQGLAVLDATLIIQFNSDGHINSVLGQYAPKSLVPKLPPKLDIDEARSRLQLSGAKVTAESLGLHLTEGGELVPAYEFVTQKSLVERDRVLVDGNSGLLLRTSKLIVNQ